MKIQPDSLIFDMDGTLWDNVNTYVKLWNISFEKLGYEKRVSREDMLGLMGKEVRQILNIVIPEESEANQDIFFNLVLEEYQQMLPVIEPTIYPGVIEGLEKLSKVYPLFLLSNCEEGGLVNFMTHTQTTHLIKDYREHGQNLQPKSYNLKDLMEKHNLKAPIYVGDTAADGHQSELAGVPFIFVDYGFGTTDRYALKFSSFDDLTNHFLELKK